MTSPEGVDNLAGEGVPPTRIHLVGNPMIDTLLANLDRFDAAPRAAAWTSPSAYAVATIHRPANVDDPGRPPRIASMLRGGQRTGHRSSCRSTRAAGPT